MRLKKKTLRKEGSKKTAQQRHQAEDRASLNLISFEARASLGPGTWPLAEWSEATNPINNAQAK